MPSFNQAAFIEAAIESVLAQAYPKLELVVQDGGSDDGTLDILARKSAEDPRLRWRSEPDDGPVQAINRALARSRGTVIGWLNSDDLYRPGAVRRAVDVLCHSESMIMVYGHGDHIDETGEFLARYPTLEPGAGIEAFHAGCFICQPTVFFRRTLYALLGPLNERYRASFDLEYWLRLFSAFPDRVGFVDSVQAALRLHDACITRNQRRVIALEGITLTKTFLGKVQPHWVSTHLRELVSLFPEGADTSELEELADDFLADVAFAFDDGERATMQSQFKMYLGNHKRVSGEPA